ncbi:MAG: hypothetical protein AAF694_01435 [Bacteroidota bacterium]
METEAHFDHILQIISDNSTLSTALQRYGITQLKLSSEQENALKEAGINGHFVWEVLCTLENPSSFNPKTFMAYPVPLILEYLKKSHTYYTQKRLGEIELNLANLQKKYAYTEQALYWEMVLLLFSSWKRHLQLHIEQEERTLFPYIFKLVAAEIDQRPVDDAYTLDHFIQHHEDDQLETGLKEICQSIRKNTDSSSSLPLSHKVLLTQLDAFERDLWVHGLIEDYVLVPKAQEIERKLRFSA